MYVVAEWLLRRAAERCHSDEDIFKAGLNNCKRNWMNVLLYKCMNERKNMDHG
jgi:hypothetical protein